MSCAQNIVQQILFLVNLQQIAIEFLLVNSVHVLLKLAEVLVLEHPVSGSVILKHLQTETYSLLDVHQAEII